MIIMQTVLHQAPAAASKQKKVTCMFIPDGQVSISARIDRKGFCEGEDISINAKFENTCSRIVVPKAAIVAKHLYVAEGHTKVTRGHGHRFLSSNGAKRLRGGDPCLCLIPFRSGVRSCRRCEETTSSPGCATCGRGRPSESPN